MLDKKWLPFLKGLLVALLAIFLFTWVPGMISSDNHYVFNLGWLILIVYAALVYYIIFIKGKL